MENGKGDLISLEAAIKMIRENGLRGEGYSREEREDNLVDMLECLPTVDAAPVVHSKWVWIPDEEEDNTWHLVCDACKHGGLFEDDNYCPNCGARMDKEESDV